MAANSGAGRSPNSSKCGAWKVSADALKTGPTREDIGDKPGPKPAKFPQAQQNGGESGQGAGEKI